MTPRSLPSLSPVSMPLRADAAGDAAVAEPGAQVRLVIGLVRVQLAGLAAARPAAGPDRGDGLDQGPQREGVVGVGRPTARGGAGGRPGRAAPGSSSRACPGWRGWGR